MNIVKTLNYLDDKDKPEIFLFYNPELKKFLNEFDYPYLNSIEWNFPSSVNGYIKSLILRRNIFITDILSKYSLNTIFPIRDFPVKYKGNVKVVSLSPDLQNKYYPEFFSKKVLLGRNIRMKLRLRNNNELVVSSKAVLDDFLRFYKIRKGINFHIYHFVSVIDNLENTSIDILRERYNLPDKYFMISNQFHKHKNHRVVLLSLVELKKKGIKKHIAITGRFPDAAKSPYIAELHKIIEENNLQDQISFLGIIPRNDQLQLMKHSQAIIQPSLFEGWSTVIEDARSLQAPVIASNLDVNIEQLGKDEVYFNPHNTNELASILINYPERNMDDVFYEDYTKRIKDASEVLINIFS